MSNNGDSNSSRNSSISENENSPDIHLTNMDKLGTSPIDVSEKIVHLIGSPKVQVMKEGGKGYIDIDIEHLDEGIYYYVEYQGGAYGIEKLSDGQVAFYEVVD
jgi:hypothetical protein